MRPLLCCILLAFSLSGFAQMTELMRYPSNDLHWIKPAHLKGKYYFNAWDSTSRSWELFSTDGTAAGTGLFVNLNNEPASGMGSDDNRAEMNGIVYFVANDGIHGNELWRSDGTAAGTYMVADVNRGGRGSDPANLFVSDSILYFSAKDNSAGRTIWQSDGTAQGSRQLDSRFYRSQFRYVPILGLINGKLVYRHDSAYTSIRAYDLQSKQESILAVATFPINPYPTVAGGKLFFVGEVGGEHELWVTDGTTANTRVVRDLNSANSSSIAFITALNSKVYFSATHDYKRGFWVTDGTAQGTVPVLPLSGSFEAGQIVKMKDTLYLLASDSGRPALWKSDGSTNGTVRIKIFDTNSAGKMIATDSQLFIATPADYPQLWRSDGTVAGTVQIDSFSGPMHLYKLASSGGLAFLTFHNYPEGYTMWRSDGTKPGTLELMNSPQGYEPALRGYAGRSILFNMYSDKGNELHSVTSTRSNPLLLRDINSGDLSFYPQEITTARERVFFSGTDTSSYNPSLYSTQGMPGTTEKLISIVSGLHSAFGVIAVSDRVLFQMLDTGFTGLWRSDGTMAGTEKYAEVEAAGYIDLTFHYVHNDRLIIERRDWSMMESDLLMTDGDTVMPLKAGPLSPSPFTRFNEASYFTNVSANNMELWRTDATPAGTYLVPTPEGLIHNVAATDSALYFVKSPTHNTNWWQLWKTDGTASGARLVDERFSYGPCSSFVAVGDRLVYLTADSSTKKLFVKSYSESGGQLLLKKTSFSSESYRLQISLQKAGSMLLFNANDSNGDAELWKTDGTVTGTELVHPFGGSFTDPYSVSYASGASYAFIQTEDGVYALRDEDIFAPVEDIRGKEVDVHVYPNPAQSELYIYNEHGDGTATLFSIDGRYMQKIVLHHGSNTLDVSTVKAGLYFLKLKIEGRELFRKLLVVD